MLGADSSQVEALVDGLVGAYWPQHEPARQPPDSPFDASRLPRTLTLPQAYDIQRRCTARLCRRWQADRAGFKVGLTNDRDQAKFSAAEPIFGHLTSRHLRTNASLLPMPIDGAVLVEPELLVRVASGDIGSSTAEEEIGNRVEVAAGLDVATTRFAGGFAEISADPQGMRRTVADNAFAGYVVFGDRWTRLTSQDSGDIAVSFRRDDVVVAEGATRHVLGNPLRAVQWLVQQLDEVGETLQPGWVVATGAILPPVRLEPRRSYHAAFGRGLGTVTIHVD